MTVADASRILNARFSKREPNVYVLERNGTVYVLHLDFAGRIYGIDYQQTLGQFGPDHSFTSSVIDKMVAKYGLYQSRSGVARTGTLPITLRLFRCWWAAKQFN